MGIKSKDAILSVTGTVKSSKIEKIWDSVPNVCVVVATGPAFNVIVDGFCVKFDVSTKKLMVACGALRDLGTVSYTHLTLPTILLV